MSLSETLDLALTPINAPLPGLEIADGSSYQFSLGSTEKTQNIKVNTAKLPLENDAITLRGLSDSVPPLHRVQ